MSDLFNKIQPSDYANKGIRVKTNPLNLPASEAQRAFDELSLDVIIPMLNAVIDVLNGLDLSTRVASGDIKGIRINADKVIEVTIDGIIWEATGSESIAASADRAEAAQTAAEAAQSAAETAKSQAETSQSAAEAAKNTAITAKEEAITAENAAETAQTKAETAQSKAEEAQTAAETAKSEAVTANTLSQANANSAEESANTAEAKATEATNQALLSKSYAVGGTGARVGEESDNAKYYCEQAQAIAGGAGGDGDFVTPTQLNAFKTANIDPLADDISKLRSNISSNETAISVLNGSGTGSVKKQIDDAFNDFATKISNDGVVNTYKELVDYCASHSAEAAEMAGNISANASNISSLQTRVSQLESTINNLINGEEVLY